MKAGVVVVPNAVAHEPDAPWWSFVNRAARDADSSGQQSCDFVLLAVPEGQGVNVAAEMEVLLASDPDPDEIRRYVSDPPAISTEGVHMEFSTTATVKVGETGWFSAFEADSYVVRATLPGGKVVCRPLEPGARSGRLLDHSDFVVELAKRLKEEA